MILKDLVSREFGEDKWLAVLSELGVDDDAVLLELKQYPDETTIAGVNATAKVLGVTFDDALKVFGAHFVTFVRRGGHLRMLESMGDSISEFMRNLNHMHAYLERQMRDAHFPCFHITREADIEDGHAFYLSYSSVRGKALMPLVEGVLPALASSLHGQDVRMEALPAPEEGYSATWLVTTESHASRFAREPRGRASSDLPSAEVETAPNAADPATRWGSLWHMAIASCCCSNSLAVAAAESIDAKAPDAAPEMSHELSLGECTVYTEANAAEPQVCELNHGPARERLDRLALEARLAADPARVLMRALPYHNVCSSWEDVQQLSRVAKFWGTNQGDVRHFCWTQASEYADRFISHSWFQPENWHEVMGSKCSYAELKGTELYAEAMEIAEVEERDHKDITFWIDKCCIPQQHSMMPFCIGLIEDFLDRCKGMIVVLSWQYFERLWCVYEWAAFLVRHPPQNVTICMSYFMRPASRDLYVESIRNLTIDNCKCAKENDRQILKSKVAEYYYSERAFENFARCSSIAMIARTLCREASRGRAAFEEEFKPFVRLAKELGLTDLATALDIAEPVAWRGEAQHLIQAAEASEAGEYWRHWQIRFLAMVEEWFMDEVVPILNRVKLASVRSEFLGVSDSREISKSTVAQMDEHNRSASRRSTSHSVLDSRRSTSHSLLEDKLKELL